MPFIDAETGTIVNGPIWFVRNDVDLEGLSDSEIIEIAQAGDFIANEQGFGWQN